MAEANTTNEPIFSDFEWNYSEVSTDCVTVPGWVYAELPNTTIAEHVATILEILERDRLSEESDDPLTRNTELALTRLAIRSAHMLRAETERSTEWAYQYQSPEGRKANAAEWARDTQR